MAHFRVARRYARALLTLAEEQKKLERIGSDVEKISALVRASRDLELFLQNPTIMKDKKTRALREIFSKTVDSTTLHFLLLLVAKGRENILMPIIGQFRLLVDEKMGIVRAEVTSAVALTEQQEKGLVNRLEGFTGKKVQVQYSLDRSLQGGFLARIGDTVFDASIRHQLELLRKKFIADGSVGN
jgi:F-type H+-transporting ATPase subunit delta